MFAGPVALLALSALTLVSAQANSNSTFKISPGDVDALTRATWCTGQHDSCETLCGSTLDNNCEPKTLDFVCECVGNSFPDMNKFKNTVPWFVCEQLQADCIKANEMNAAGQKNCTATFEDHCGTEDVQDHQGEGAATTPTGSSSSTSAGPQSTGPTTTTTQPQSTSVSKGASAPTARVHHIGNGAAAAALGLLAYAL